MHGLDAKIQFAELTELDRPPSKPETREHHLAQTEGGTEAGEKTHGHDSKQVEEETDKDGINEAQVEQGLAEHTNGEGTHDHVCGQPLGLVSGKPIGLSKE